MSGCITKSQEGHNLSGREPEGRGAREILELLDEIETLAEQNYRRILRRISEVRELLYERRSTQSMGQHVASLLDSGLAPLTLPAPVIPSEGQARRPRGMPTETEVAVLRMISTSPEKREAPLIAREIGKSREHTARLLKKMSDAGYLTRKEEVWPYTYILTERAQRFLESQL